MYVAGEVMTGSRSKKKSSISVSARSVGERSEPKRSAETDSTASLALPSSEVEAKPTRRRHTTEYKLQILREVNACAPGSIGAILRREGLYSSQLHKWRKQQENGLSQKKRGRKATTNDPLAIENARMEREIRRLNERLRKAEIIIHVQKKLCDVLGLEVPPIPEIEEKS